MQQHALRQTHRPQKPQRSKRKVWKNFTLKLSLFRIWFFKNILVWVSTAAIICLICILTGNITAETPFLGKFIYPLFAPIIDEIVAIIEEDDISNIMDFFAVSVSVISSVIIFSLRVKAIMITDIKSDKLKLALVQANLYFNQDGRLVKKVEKMTRTDIDGDGKIDGEKMTKGERRRQKLGPISALLNAFSELAVILKADFSETDSTKSGSYKKVLKRAKLDKAKKGKDEVFESVREGMVDIIIDKGIDATADKITETVNDVEMTLSEKVEKNKKLNEVKSELEAAKEKREKQKRKKKIKAKKKTVKKVKKPVEPVIVETVEKSVEPVVEEIVKPEPIQEETVILSQPKQVEPKHDNNLEGFFSQFGDY